MNIKEKRAYLLERLQLAKSLHQLLGEILVPFDDIDGGYSDLDDKTDKVIKKLVDYIKNTESIKDRYEQYQRECISQIEQDL